MVKLWRVLGCSSVAVMLVSGVACREEEEPLPPAQERCNAQTRTFNTGSLDAKGGQPGAFELGQSSSSGRIQGKELVVAFGDAQLGDMLLRLRISDVDGEFEELASRAVTDGPLTLQVVDTSAGAPAESESRTALTSFNCELRSGQVCVQVGFDSDGDGFLTDADTGVFNASAGEVVVEALANRSNEVELTWTLTLGANLSPLAQEDDATPGVGGGLEGCLNGRYTQREPGIFDIR